MKSALHERFRTLGERYRTERTKHGRKHRRGEAEAPGFDRAAFRWLGEAGMFRVALEPSMGGEGLPGAVGGGVRWR